MDDIESGLQEARDCFREGRYEHAKTLYTSALDTLHALPLPQDIGEKLSAMIYNERGLCQYKMVCFDEAVEDFTNAVRLNPSLGAAYYSRATINYRLLAGYPHGSSEREALGQKAVDDFKRAITLDPLNIDFREGLRSCEDEIQGGLGDDNVCVLNLENVPLATLVKLLFLLDAGDQGPGITYRREARQAKETFLTILRSREQGHQQIVRVLQRRAKDLQEFRSSHLPVNAEAASRYCIRKEEEDLLVLAKCCDRLGVKYHHLEDKIKQVQDKMELEENEKEGNFVINAENLLMSNICDCLTPELVYKLFCLAVSRDGWKFWEGGDASVVQEEQLTEDGVKEALFFFIVRQMEEKMLLNRIYTDKLQGLLKELCEDSAQNEVLNTVIQKLKNYPDECQPPGLCLVFCVKERREGSDIEITKIKSVFGDLFKFTVKIEEDPNQSTLKHYHKKELLKAKYKFYDSLVIWFVSHGDEKNLILAGKDEKYDRESFIDDFSCVSTFNMKPKIFFMGTCRGNTPIPINNLGGRKGDLDGCSTWQDGPGSNRGRVTVPLNSQDISNIYYQMDRIVSYATLPSHTAFRVKDEGSVFVDTVCAQLEESQGQNITQVLEAVCQVIHQIVFCIEEREDLGNTKQACFYESTFQKTFLVPRMKADLT